ncbi:hypothetical protein [Mucilaginibacter flavidus]|uniref:hypothetical protein n=1 Tax=Mucilaginibacter flavidus TaxID=2949309 RepID=UPI0020928341|nr:hypothetical protein [Mucilaginibacter flavidus]MCO5950074.1 hypothetical protein [Mucilaginibacter flavidus]
MAKSKKGTIIGNDLSGPDNYSYMNQDQHEVNVCDCLDYVRNRRLHISPKFKLKKTQYDVSYTFDSYLIVSERFKDFCIQNNYENVVFYSLPNNPKKFFMDILNQKRYDLTIEGIRYIEFNPACGEYNEVVGAHPIYLEDSTPLADGFYRTDIEFGRSYAKGPLYMVGVETREKLKMEKFKGLYMCEILTHYL